LTGLPPAPAFAVPGGQRVIRARLATGYTVGQNPARCTGSATGCNRTGVACEYEGSAARVSGREDQLRSLLVRGLAGDAGSYRDFLRDLAGFLRAYLRGRLVRIPDDVEDLVQETLLAVHNQRHTYDPAQPLTAWVHAIARYKMVDLLRRRSVREDLHEPLDEESVFAASEDEARDAKRDLAVLLDRLPDRYRLPIRLVKIDGLSVAEAAQRTRMSESAIKVGIHRGLRKLAALVREDDE